MREKIAEIVFQGVLDGLTVDKIADAILSLPSGLVAGEHELTLQEALEDYRRIISDYPSYPHIGYYNGKRITKPIPPSEDK